MIEATDAAAARPERPRRGSVRWGSLVALLGLALLVDSAPARAADDYLYTLQPGDNPWNLSERFLRDMSYWPRLVAHNRIADDRRLPPGSTLRIPRDWLRLRASALQLGAFTGEVQVDLGDGQGWRSAETGQRLAAGSRLRTPGGASAALQLADGSRVLVLPDSELHLREAAEVGAGALSLRIELLRGRLENAVHPMRASGSRFEIQTPSAVTAVRGTEFRIAADARSTRSEVLDGAVSFGNARGQLTLAQGTGSLAQAGLPPQPPRRLLAPPRLEGLATHWQEAQPRLVWPALRGASAYRVQLAALDATDPAAVTLALDASAAEPRLHLPPLPDGRYRLRLRGVDSLGLEGLSAQQLLTIDTQPPPPLPQAPAGTQPVTPQAGTLRWRPADTRVAGAEGVGSERRLRYRLQIAAADRGFAAPLADLAGDDSLACALPVLPAGRYQWRIASLLDDDQGPWSAVQHLQLVTATPELIGIELDERLRLRWQGDGEGPGEGGGPVRLQIARDAGFTEVLLDELRHGRQADLPRPAAGRYHLRVGRPALAGRPVGWGRAQSLEVHGLRLLDDHAALVRADLNALPPTGAGPAPQCAAWAPAAPPPLVPAAAAPAPR